MVVAALVLVIISYASGDIYCVSTVRCAVTFVLVISPFAAFVAVVVG